jgi:hypothetical protein
MLAERATLDLKPLAANARQKIEAALADFRNAADGVKVDASVSEVRLVGVAFDNNTLRIVTDITGTPRITVSSLPAL